MSPRAEAMLGPLFSAFTDLGATAQAVTYADDALDDVRAELMDLDGVIVWVNPIQDGATRVHLDALLRDVSAAGVWVSADPEVIDKMGTKEVLHVTQSLSWGSDTAIYRSPEELAQGFPKRLGSFGRLVVKQARGTSGNGVWRVEVADSLSGGDLGPDTPVLIQRSEPRTVTPLEESTLGSFLETCNGYFGWSGSIIDQPYQDRVADGMIRAYFVHDQVAGFCHQWPKGLVTPGNTAEDDPPRVPAMEDSDAAAYAGLRTEAENEWVPGMQKLLGLSAHDLPVIWDADFLYGPKTTTGADTYVLCEINVQAVWPFPPLASRQLVAAAVERATDARSARGSRPAVSFRG